MLVLPVTTSIDASLPSALHQRSPVSSFHLPLDYAKNIKFGSDAWVLVIHGVDPLTDALTGKWGQREEQWLLNRDEEVSKQQKMGWPLKS